MLEHISMSNFFKPNDFALPNHMINKFFALLLGVLLVGSSAIESIATTINDSDGSSVLADATITGELRKWHKVTLTFTGPNVDEQSSNNPFLNYRLNVTFTHSGSGKTYLVPGYFAADGNAAETSAAGGNKWRVHFAPDETGTWNYQASFRQGTNVAVSDNQSAGSPTSFDGDSGSFNISSSNKSGKDLRGKGRLQYVGDHYLRFAETGEAFLKGGADAPENLLAYNDFDGTYNGGGANNIKSWSPHAGDWQSGDPSWQGSKGRELIGAINYLSNKGMNVFSFLTMNINGDGFDVWMFTNEDERVRYDVSKLAQWEILFEHADKKGMYLHFKTQETENNNLLDGGNLGNQRKLYYRELIARFGHHLALNWNLGEENTQSTGQRKDMAQYFHDHDPYRHNVVLHTHPNQQSSVYTPLLGSASKLSGVSIQTGRSNVHKETMKWVEQSASSNKKWVVANDEQGSAEKGVPHDAYSGSPDQDDVRATVLWGNLMAGGAGVEYYFGYQLPCDDLDCEDWRSRDKMWDYTRYALEFFRNHLPFDQMKTRNDLIGNGNDNNQKYCFAKPGDTYAVYLQFGGSTNLDLQSNNSTFTIKWYDPRSGGSLKNGSKTSISGGGNQSLGNPPNSTTEDWVILVTKNGGTSSNNDPNASFTANPTSGSAPLTVNVNASNSSDSDGNIVSYAWDFGNGTTDTGITSNATYNSAGTYSIRLTVTDNDGATDTHTISVVATTGAIPNDDPVASFTASATSGPAPLSVNLNASGSSDADGNIVSYSWNYGNGNSGTGVTSSVTYNTTGTYNIRLTVTDNDGATDTETITVNVSGATSNQEVLRFRLIDAQTDQDIGALKEGDVIDLANNPEITVKAITDPGTVGSVTFNMDGPQNFTSTENAAPYTLFGDNNGDINAWSNPPVGSCTLTATPFTDSNGNGTAGTSITISFSIINNSPIANVEPIADFTASTTSGPAPLTVNLNASSSSDSDGNIVSYSWNYGNGNSGTGVTSNVTYNTAGTYNIRLTVTDNDGATNTKTITVNVSGSTSNQEVLRFRLFNSLTDKDNGGLRNGDVIDIGDNPNITIRAITDPGIVGSVVFQLSGAANHTFTDNSSPYGLYGGTGSNYAAWPNPSVGNYTLTATPFTSSGGNGTAGKSFTVNFSIVNNSSTANVDPVASFTATPASGTAPLSVNLNASSSSDSDGNIVSYSWNYGNGNSGTGVTSSVTYNTPGTYSVRLLVTDNDGGTDVKTLTVNATSDDASEGELLRFRLFNAQTNQDNGRLSNGDVIDLALNPKINVRAITNPDPVGSVKFELSGAANHSNTESEAPYALFGDVDGVYNEWSNPSLGNYTLTATPYSQSSGGGSPGKPLTINFSIINSATSSAFSGNALSGFRLINTENGSDMGPIRNGQIINLTANPNISIEAMSAYPEIESVEFNLSGTVDYTHTIDDLPYALYGHENGNYVPLENPEVGDYSLVARPYYRDSNKRTISGDEIAVNFSIVQPIPIEPMKVYPNPSSGNFKLTFTSDLNLTPKVYLYDLLGTRIDVNYQLDSYFSGRYQLSVQTEELPNAIYILKLRVSDQDGRSGLVNKKISIIRSN